MKQTHLNELPIIPEDYDVSTYEKVDYTNIRSEMSIIERRFINGLIRYYEPEKLLEVGVSRGGGTVNLLNAILDRPGRTLTCIERLEHWYKDETVSVAADAKAYYPEFPQERWKLLCGKDPSEVMPTLGEQFDFVVLDTAHIHPVEALNFLCLLPFLKDGAIVVLHDISLHFRQSKPTCMAARLLLSALVGDKLIPATPETVFGNITGISNIAAIQIDQNTRHYIGNVFEALMLPWESYTSDVESNRAFLHKYYPPKLTKLFDMAARVNSVWHASCRMTFDEEQLRALWAVLASHETLFYGAGSNMRSILTALQALNIGFAFPIWDQNAAHIGSIEGNKVSPPDFTTAAKPGRLAVITLLDSAEYKKVRDKLTDLGYTVVGNIDQLGDL